MNAKNLFFHIHYCNHREFRESRRLPPKITRTIQHHELMLITGGKGKIIIEKKKYPAGEGMLFYICPDVLHSIIADPEDPFCFLSVHFSYARVSYNDNTWDIANDAPTLSLHSGQKLKDYYQIEDIFRKLVESWNGKLPGYEFVSKTLLQQLLMAVFQNLKKQDQNYSTSAKIEKIIKHMHQNITKRVTLNELAEIVDLSSFYLSRAFKSTTGYSVIEYFNKIKIDKAKELIIEGDKKVKEVAKVLGFSDEFYFSRVFKRIEGISPSEFYSKNVHGE